jgi:hypothetical protein
MVTNTIDYLVSFIIVTAILASSIFIASQTINIALINQQDQQTTLASLDLLNNLLQNSGNPLNWGQINIKPSGFGLKWPNVVSEMLSPFTLMRLLRTGETINYNNIIYQKLSIGNGPTLILQEDRKSTRQNSSHTT